MNNPLDPSLRDLNDCGCCTGTRVQTPASTDNRPGLPSLQFRAGVHSQFLATLLAGLSSQSFSGLRGLRTRDTDDFTIALLDAFACTADVLTFYSERIANEAYLRTATERRSVLELARAIGYELAPGVAAEVMAAFTVESGVGAPGTAIIPKGTKLQSIPGPEEKPQVYETSLEFTAHAAWNEIRPRLRSAPPDPEKITQATQLYLAGTSTNLKLGDVLVLSDGSTAVARRILGISADRDRNQTYVRFQDAADPESVLPAAARETRVAAARVIGTQPTQDNVHDVFHSNVTSSQIHALGHFHRWDVSKVQQHLNSLPNVTLFPAKAGVFALRARAGFFGHNAPKWDGLPDEMIGAGDAYPKDWDDLSSSSSAPVASKIWQDSQGNDLNPPIVEGENPQFDVLLERVVPEVVAESWIVLETEETQLIPLRVGRNSELSRADFAMSAKCARLNLKEPDGETDPEKSAVYTTRGTSAHLQSEALEVIGTPIDTQLNQGLTTLELDRIDLRLYEGQRVALSGENADLPGTRQSEMILVAAIHHSDVTTLTLREGIQHSYLRSTVKLNANVVPATHGETTREVLGSGDATRTFQTFTLKQQPLTYAFPLGAGQPEASLAVWVNDVRWRAVNTFYGSGPRDRIYVVRRADDGTTQVQFGDGQRGARLPTGIENVRAAYRTGIGLAGLAKEEQISLLLSRPLGVKAVVNPLPPQGAEDPQSLDDARVNAPLTVLTLDRVVSLQDYEDFARNFPGVSKAHATWVWAGHTRGVLLTLLGPNGRAINESGQPADPLRTALIKQGIARVPVRLVSRPASLFSISGKVRVDADHLPSVIRSAIQAALIDNFSFAAREFGRGIHLSEVIAVIQMIPGVAFVDVTRFQKKSLVEGETVTIDASRGYLNVTTPSNGGDLQLVEPAELLIFDESSLPQLEVESL